MRQFILLCFVCLLTTNILAQDNAINKYFSEFQNDPEITKVNVTGKMFSLFTEMDTDDEDEKAILEAIAKLKGIKAIIDDNAENGNKMYYDAVKRVGNDSNYEELMSVEDNKENVKFLIRDNNGIISELLMLRGAEREFMVMTLYGEIDLTSISRLSKVMRVRGMEGFGLLKEHEHGHKDH